MTDTNSTQSPPVSASAVTADTVAVARPQPTAQRHELNATARNVAASMRRPSMSPVLLAGLIRLLEFGVLFLVGAVAYVIYLDPVEGMDWWYLAPLAAGSLATVLAIQSVGGYSIATLRHGLPDFGRVFLAWTGVFVAFTVFAFLAKVGDAYSRVWVATWYISGVVALVAMRASTAALVRSWTASGALERRAVIVGGGQAAEELIHALDAQPDSDVHICGIFDDRKDDRSPATVAGYRKLGTISELVDFGRLAHIDLLIVSLPITAENRLLQFLKQLWVLPVDIRLSAHMSRLHFRPRTYSFVGKVPFFDVADKPIADWDYVVKSLFDRIVGGLILLLVSPVMLAVALAVRLDSPGPVLFKQKRYGFNNELIEVYKFRSMYTNMTDARADRLVTRDDPRVTRVGRFIRKTSLDELPQLFNVVFKGNLSLVGPRPHAVQAKASNRLYDEVVDGYFARHRVKPGITGWAQVNGWRGETDTEEKIQQRVQHDLYYIENWSVWLDLKILARTPFSLLSTRNAY
ncbi:MAG TPA: undecaprenyl-phosphate glucose phosphotransferase [Bauldia sp.]|nr:undecaprenyl-phosphate glucose phosphotransferase [Bauldia sp.]